MVVIDVNSKVEFRKVAKELLNIESKRNKLLKDKLAQKRLLKLLKYLNSKKILFYIPLNSEVDIMPLIKLYRTKREVEVFVPFMESVSFKMVKFSLPLLLKNFGIKEPTNSLFNLSKIDTAVIPILGVDMDYKRVGFGKGMYDRFFSKLKIKPVKIFIQLKGCFTPNKITDSYDINANYLITPNETLKIERGMRYVNRVTNRRWSINN